MASHLSLGRSFMTSTLGMENVDELDYEINELFEYSEDLHASPGAEVLAGKALQGGRWPPGPDLISANRISGDQWPNTFDGLWWMGEFPSDTDFAEHDAAANNDGFTLAAKMIDTSISSSSSIRSEEHCNSATGANSGRLYGINDNPAFRAGFVSGLKAAFGDTMPDVMQEGGSWQTALLPQQPMASEAGLPVSTTTAQKKLMSSTSKTLPKNKRFKTRSVPEHLCFSFALGGRVEKRKRDRQDEINQMRKIGACFRCKVLKLRCTGGSPCQQCSQTFSRALQSKTLVPYDCVRYHLKDVSPFGSSTNMDGIMTTMQLINKAQVDVMPFFDLPSPISASSLARTLTKNLHVPAHPPESNIIGALMTNSTRELLSTNLGSAHLLHNFLVSSALLNAKRKGATSLLIEPAELETLRRWAGSELFQHLDRDMSPRALNASTKEQLESLFLVVLGAIIGINYNDSSITPCAITSGDNRSPVSSAALTLLGHYLAYLGLRTSTLPDEKIARMLLDHAQCNWHLFNEVSTLADEEEKVRSAFPLDLGCESEIGKYDDQQLDLNADVDSMCGSDSVTVESRQNYPAIDDLTVLYTDDCCVQRQQDPGEGTPDVVDCYKAGGPLPTYVLSFEPLTIDEIYCVTNYFDLKEWSSLTEAPLDCEQPKCRRIIPRDTQYRHAQVEIRRSLNSKSVWGDDELYRMGAV